MAFRDEIDALRQRAETAEKELASQTDRIGRVAEIEGQLEDARRQIREAKLDPKAMIGRGVPWLLLGLFVGSGLVYVWSSARLTALRTEMDVEGARAAGERADVDERADVSDRARALAERERDDAVTGRIRATQDLVTLLRLIERESGTAAPPGAVVETPVGRVGYSTHPGFALGTPCVVEHPPTIPGCAAALRCGATLTGLGCADGAAAEITFDLRFATIRSHEGDVAIVFGELVPTEVISTPSGVLPGWGSADLAERIRAATEAERGRR